MARQPSRPGRRPDSARAAPARGPDRVATRSRVPAGGRPAPGSPPAARGELARRLADAVAALGLSLGPDVHEGLLDYLELLARWNRHYNLTAIRDPRDMVAAHLADSLAILPFLDSLGAGALVVDVGSGAGLPGIPVQLARPELRVALVEPVGKKAAFLRQCKAELALDRLDVHAARIQDVVFDAVPAVITSRAFAALDDFVAAVSCHAGPATRLLAMKGVTPTGDLDRLRDRALPWRVVSVVPLDVPGLAAERCVVVLEPAAPGSSSSTPADS